MAADDETIKGLRDFFGDSFTASELKMFLSVNGYGEVASAVDPGVGGLEYFFEVARALERRGLIDDAFFDHLERERPRKRVEIQAFRGRPAAGPSGPTPSAEPPPDGTPASSAALPPPRNTQFLPRTDRGGRDIFEALHARPGTDRRVVLHGMPAVGKTQAVLEYAYRYSEDRPNYSDVFWTIADTEDQLRAGLLGIAMRLGIPTDRPVTEVMNAVKAELGKRDGWLWVIDNALDFRMATQYLPAPKAGRVLVTTTRPESELHVLSALPVELTHFYDDADGARFLLALARLLKRDQSLEEAHPDDAAAARALSEAVGGLPLALDQAAVFIEATSSSPREYLEQYRRRGEELRRLRTPIPGDDRDHANVTVTFALIFERLEKESPATADLLRLLAFFAPSAIPEEILTVGAPVLGDRLGPAVSANLPLSRMPALRDRLLTRDRRTATLSVHRLVQDVLRDRMDESSRMLWAERAVRALNLAVPEIERLDLDQIDRTLSHLRACTLNIDRFRFSFPEAGRLLDKTGCQLFYLARYDESLLLLDRALALTEAALGSDHPDTARTLNNKAILLQNRADFAGAEPLFRRALEIREATLGPNDPETATSLNNLAVLLQEKGKPSEAEPLHRRALAIREKSLGPDHPSTADSLNNLASLMREQEKLSEAEPLFRRALAIREKGLRPDHPDTAQTLNNLADLLRAQGKLQEAEPLHRRAVAIHEKSLGPDHPETATSFDRLATLLQVREKLSEAEPLFRRALTIRENSLGPNHRSTGTSLNNLALLMREQGKLSEAKPLFRRAVTIYEKGLGPDHPETANCLDNLAGLLREQGNPSEAEPLFRQAWTALEKSYGPDHVRTNAVLLNYLTTLQHRGRRAELRSVLARLDPKRAEAIKLELKRRGS